MDKNDMIPIPHDMSNEWLQAVAFNNCGYCGGTGLKVSLSSRPVGTKVPCRCVWSHRSLLLNRIDLKTIIELIEQESGGETDEQSTD